MKARMALAILLLGTMILNLCCTPSGSITEEPEQASFHTVDLCSVYASAGMEHIFETEESVYYLCSTADNDYQLFFSDKRDKEWLPLSGKPNCPHTTEDCSSMLEGDASNKVWLYGEHIYYLIGTDIDGTSALELWRMELDGSAHDKLCAYFEDRENTGAAYAYEWYFHNKYAVVMYHLMDLERGGFTTETYRIDLSSKDLKPVRLDIPEEISLGNPIAGKGSDLYCVCGTEGHELIKADLDAGSAQLLCTLPFEPDLFSCMLKDGSLIFAEGWELGKILRVDTESGMLSTIASAEPQTRRWYYPYGDYIFGSNTSSVPSLAGTEVSDLSGNLVIELPHSEGEADITISKIIGDFVFGYERGAANYDPTALPGWYLDIKELGTDSFGWHRWATDD